MRPLDLGNLKKKKLLLTLGACFDGLTGQRVAPAPVNPSSSRQPAVDGTDRKYGGSQLSLAARRGERVGHKSRARSAPILSSYPAPGVASPYVAVRKQAL